VVSDSGLKKKEEQPEFVNEKNKILTRGRVTVQHNNLMTFENRSKKVANV